MSKGVGLQKPEANLSNKDKDTISRRKQIWQGHEKPSHLQSSQGVLRPTVVGSVGKFIFQASRLTRGIGVTGGTMVPKCQLLYPVGSMVVTA